MRFFDTRVLKDVYGGRYFITSERFDDDTPRLYTVREADDNGRISTVGEFQGHATILDAQKEAKRLAAAL